ncbi:MAG: DUF4395 domain-containing protein [Deltaproteobacteria bacterium]|nr:DUF4395 domain-containing protein [Deltaproteobacteria bacterium]
MKEMCPISFNQVNERAVQINAALAVFSIIFFFLTPYKWIILVLAIDFFIRGFLNPSYSFCSAISKTILRIFKIKSLMVNAGPKIFAAKIGFIFCCMTAIFYLFNFQKISLIIGSIFVFFAALEAIFKFCMACRIYPFIYKFKNNQFIKKI